MLSVSMMPHVRMTVNRSPTMIVLRSVFQKHLIGSTSTSPGCRVCVKALGADDAGLAAAGLDAGACARTGAASDRNSSNDSVVFIGNSAVRQAGRYILLSLRSRANSTS